MAFIIGFGSEENRAEENEFEVIREFCRDTYLYMNCDYVTDDFVNVVEEFVKKRGAISRGLADSYRKSDDFPDRYSSFYPTVLHDASNVVVILRFSHYNRRHALSPDGWAVLCRDRTEVVLYSCDMLMEKRKEAS